jgi:hypothetical protein
MRERRTLEGYRLRIYIDAIKEAKTMTNAEWVEAWSKRPEHETYIPRLVWIDYLEQCAMIEADKLAESRVA